MSSSGLLKELTTSRTLEKVLVREEARHTITKHVNAISLVKIEKEKNVQNNEDVGKSVIGLNELNIVAPNKVVDIKKEVKDKTDAKPTRSEKEELMGDKIKELVEMPRSQPVGFYLKHKINRELIEGLIGNQRFNYSLLAVQLGKMEREAYDSLPIRLMHNTILNKKITKKENMGGNFVIPCNIGGLKYMDALVDQGSDVNVMPLSLYNKLTNEELVGTDIRLSQAIHSYIYSLGIAEDVLAEIASFVYPIDFMILDIKEDKRIPSS
ncbi:MAK10-like protein [Tanacetum coccineum]